jgi:hypothetical protein
MIVNIDKKDYHVNNNEFKFINIQEYCNLKLHEDIGFFERMISLFVEFKKCGIKNINFLNTTHGGFLPIQCSNNFDIINLINTHPEHIENIEKNIIKYKMIDKFNNINIFLHHWLFYVCNSSENSIIFSNNSDEINFEFLQQMYKENILITKFDLKIVNSKIFKYLYNLKNTDYFIYLNDDKIEQFKEVFKYYLEDNCVLHYDNLIHLCIMVKNGGPQFEDMLTKNLPIIDRWTILDTGSTDNTIDIINKVLVGKKKGDLFQEPFINFKDSRNRCLDLAGKECKFIIMLDDTYIVEGNLRNFLHTVRGDQISNSFSVFIKSDDVEYASNRIIKSQSDLRYIYKIHEVITDKNNLNIIIPKKDSFIKDERFDYMEERTMNRKQLDLKLLYEEMNDNPNEPRTYYYLGQTYNLIKDYEKAYEYFLKRGTFTNSGFIQERIDAVFEAARLANFKLNKPWEECLTLYEKAYKIDESRPEPLYYIGLHYHLEGNNKLAYDYFKKGFKTGFPDHCQYSLKPTLSYHFLPKFLTRICYEMRDYILGEESAEFFLTNNQNTCENYAEIASWYNIYKKLNLCPTKKTSAFIPEKPIFCFIADGGFEPWTGKNILTTGVGGSETYIIEMARYIQKNGCFKVIVFCNCLEEDVFENVEYKPLSIMYSFINTNYIHTCIVSRFSEYLPVVYNGFTENVYLVVHDLTPTGIVIPLDKKLKKVFCLTEWHVEYLNSIFPSLKHLTTHFYYGIDFLKFNQDKLPNKISKFPYKFIYSSFPNRGLLPLLQMWPKIYEKQPLATLHIYSDINGTWVNSVAPEQINEIKKLLQDYYSRENNIGIHYYGWVDKKTLANAWLSSDIWFYPCIFMETFCLTALEAALTKTFVICNDLAALQNTVSNRGVIINGNPMDPDWQSTALNKIFEYIEPLNFDKKNELIEQNYQWALTLSWESQAKKLLDNNILDNTLEYHGVYNWIDNLPTENDKDIFITSINYLNYNYNYNKNDSKNDSKINILEIGTYSGVSLINIVKLIPNSIGYGIDKWEDYTYFTEDGKEEYVYAKSLEIEKSFYKNIKNKKLHDKIIGMKGDSKELLQEILCIKNISFDLIYINNTNHYNNLYIDLFLSWKLLNKKGMLIVNNYKIKNIFQTVNTFLIEIKNQYKILNDKYRLFLEKI